MRKPILCLDFDGVLHSYTSGWHGASTVSDPPVEGAMSFLVQAVVDFEVHVFSSRSNQPGGVAAMQDWMIRHMREYLMQSCGMDEDIAQQRAILKVTRSIEWPTEKPPASVTLDDRAIQFTGSWPSIDELKRFKPWNK